LNPPAAPSYINITAVATSVCGGRIYRYATQTLTSGAAAYAPAISYEWTFTGILGATAILDSGSLNGQVIRIKFTGNSAAFAGDSVRVRFFSSCGYSANKSTKLTNTALLGCQQVSTGKIDFENKFDIVLFPNPTHNNFNLQVKSTSTKTITVRIFDVQGRLIKTLEVFASDINNIGNDLKSGTYMFEITQGKEKKTVRGVKY
jgi:hypothetical protein